MQASRTAHYAWLYRGSRASQGTRAAQGSQTNGWPAEAASRAAVAPDATALRSRLSPFATARSRDLPTEAGLSPAMARAHFIEAQIGAAVQSGIRQMVWLGPRSAHSTQQSTQTIELGIEVEVFRLEEDTLRGSGRERGARAVLDRSLVRSARTLFVCDGLLDRLPSAQIQAILRTIGDSCFGSRLACLYLDHGVISGNLASAGGHKPRRAVPRLGEPTEPTQLGLEMRTLPGLLACAGLVLDADVSLSEYVRRYQSFAGAAASDLRSYGCYRLVAAHVRAPLPVEPSDQVDAADSDVN